MAGLTPGALYQSSKMKVLRHGPNLASTRCYISLQEDCLPLLSLRNPKLQDLHTFYVSWIFSLPCYLHVASHMILHDKPSQEQPHASMGESREGKQS